MAFGVSWVRALFVTAILTLALSWDESHLGVSIAYGQSGQEKFQCYYGTLCTDKYCYAVIPADDGNNKLSHTCCTTASKEKRTACVHTGAGDLGCPIKTTWKKCDSCYQFALSAECPTGKKCTTGTKVNTVDVNECLWDKKNGSVEVP